MIAQIHNLSRRGLLRAASAAGLLASVPTIARAAATDQMPAGPIRFRSVSADTRPLADAGLPNYAVRISSMADPILAAVFANRLAPGDAGAPRLIVKIKSIALDHNGNVGRTPFNIEDRDWISGEGEIVDAHGKVLKSAPIETSSGAFDPGGDIVSVENIRTQRLITILAEWVDRSI